MKKAIFALLIISALLVSPVAAGKRYFTQLTVAPDVVQAGDTFDVHGCDFDTSLGNVLVGFTGGSWGSSLDALGCFTIQGIPALSGDTLPAGTYDVTASQKIHGHWKVTGTTTITVVE